MTHVIFGDVDEALFYGEKLGQGVPVRDLHAIEAVEEVD